jgi:hypothetical protein
MSYLHYLCLFVYSGVQPTLCCVVLCFVFLCLVYPMLPDSLDCPFLIVPSIFSNIYSVKTDARLLEKSLLLKFNLKIVNINNILPIIKTYY